MLLKIKPTNSILYIILIQNLTKKLILSEINIKVFYKIN